MNYLAHVHQALIRGGKLAILPAWNLYLPVHPRALQGRSFGAESFCDSTGRWPAVSEYWKYLEDLSADQDGLNDATSAFPESGYWRGRGEFRTVALVPHPELKHTFHGIRSLAGSGERICNVQSSVPGNHEYSLPVICPPPWIGREKDRQFSYTSV